MPRFSRMYPYARKSVPFFLSKLSKKAHILVPGIFIAFLVFLLLVPSLSFRLGNLFFGEKPRLYDVRLARFFYERAAYPLFGQKVPPYAHYQLSRTCFIMGDLPCSLREAEKELVLFPAHTLSYYVLGLTYGYMGLEQNAIGAFKTYIKHAPDTWAGRNDLAWLQFRTGDVYGALETIRFAAQLQPSNPWLANTYGVMLMNTGQFEEARRVLEQGYGQAKLMTGDYWGYAYPGNDPRIYEQGAMSLRRAFEENLAIVKEKIGNYRK